MTYDQLVAFLAVARASGFTAAAAALHKSQPAVSKLVRGLEEELGLGLFDRTAYRATLTEAGRLFYERATSVVEDTDALRSYGLELAGMVEPVVRLAVDAVTPLPPVLELLRSVQGRHPAVRIELRTERLGGVVAALRDGSVDLVVAAALGSDRRGLESAPFRRVAVLPVARHDHPLARCGTPIPPALLRAQAQIVLADSARGAEALSLNALEGGLRWTVTDLASKREVIAAGMGWGGLPEHVVADAIARGELVRLDVSEFEADGMDLRLMRRREGVRGPVAQALWHGLRRVGARE